MTDSNVEMASLQTEIGEYIGMNNANIIYEYKEGDGKVNLDVITVNPRHRQSFLFHSVEGFSKVDTLQKMLKYVQNYRESESSYTLQWSLKGENELHTSYFRAHNIMEAIDKLHFGRDPQSITIFSVVLNPIA